MHVCALAAALQLRNSTNQNNSLHHLTHHVQLNSPQPPQQISSQPSQINDSYHSQIVNEDPSTNAVITSSLSTYNPILQFFRIVTIVIHILDNILTYMFFEDEYL